MFSAPIPPPLDGTSAGKASSAVTPACAGPAAVLLPPARAHLRSVSVSTPPAPPPPHLRGRSHADGMLLEAAGAGGRKCRASSAHLHACAQRAALPCALLLARCYAWLRPRSSPGCRRGSTAERPSSAVEISVKYLRTSMVLRPFLVECELRAQGLPRGSHAMRAHTPATGTPHSVGWMQPGNRAVGPTRSTRVHTCTAPQLLDQESPPPSPTAPCQPLSRSRTPLQAAPATCTNGLRGPDE